MQKVVNGLKKNWIRNSLIAIYVLLVLGISATAKAEFTTLPIFLNENQAQAAMFEGQVAVTLDGQAFLAVSNHEIYRLASNIDLSEFNGQNVIVEAYEVQYRVDPVLELNHLDPLLDDSGETKAIPVLVVLGITEIN